MVVVAEPVVAVTLRALLIPLGTLLAWACARGLISIADKFVRALFGTLTGSIGWIPWLGRVATAPIGNIEHKLIGALGDAAETVDAKVGAAYHQLAKLVEWVGREIAANAALGLALARVISNPLSIPAWKALQTQLTLKAKAAAAGLATAIFRLHAVEVALRHADRGYIGAAIHALTRPIAARLTALDRWTHARVTALQHAIAVDIPADIAGLRKRTRSIEDTLDAAWAKIREHERAFGAAAFAGAVAFALERLGAGWIRCNPFSRNAAKLCAIDDSLMTALLADTLAIVGTISIVELARELQAIMPEVTSVVRAGIREAG